MEAAKPLGRGWRLLGRATVVVCLLVLGAAVLLAVSSYRSLAQHSPHADSFAGLGYFVAALIAAPAVLSLAVTTSGLSLAKRADDQVLSRLLLALGVVPIMLVLGLLLAAEISG